MSTDDSPVTSDPVREPLFQKATLVAGVTAVCTVLGALGIQVRPELRDAVIGLTPLVAIVVPFVTALAARKHVTPVSDPRDRDGTPLVPQEKDNAKSDSRDILQALAAESVAAEDPAQ